MIWDKAPPQYMKHVELLRRAPPKYMHSQKSDILGIKSIKRSGYLSDWNSCIRHHLYRIKQIAFHQIAFHKTRLNT